MEPIISFRDFGFQYRAQAEPTLRHINLDIYPGEKVLIAGAQRQRQKYADELHQRSDSLQLYRHFHRQA